jgi:uncharacterized RDD family membrane protein YckC
VWPIGGATGKQFTIRELTAASRFFDLLAFFLQFSRKESCNVFQQFAAHAYAGFWRRVAASLIDSVIILMFSCPLGIVLGIALAFTGINPDSPEAPAFNLLINGMSLLIDWLFYSLFESSSWQATPGKKLLQLKVTDLNGNRIGFGKATGRYFAKILSGLILGIGFIMVAFTEKKQGLHDMMAGTLVVKDQETAMQVPPSPPSFDSTFGAT